MKKVLFCFFVLLIFLPLFEDNISFAEGSVIDMFEEQNQEDDEINTEEESNTINNTDNVESDDSSSTNLFFDLVKLFLALGFVIAIIYILLKWVNGKNKMFHKVRTLENLGGVPLGSNKSLQVVRVGDRFYVVGVGENVELLSEITDEKTKEELMARDNNVDFKPASFLSAILKQDKRQEKAEQKQSTNNFTNLFESELKRLVEGRKNLKKHVKHKEEDSHE